MHTDHTADDADDAAMTAGTRRALRRFLHIMAACFLVAGSAATAGDAPLTAIAMLVASFLWLVFARSV